MMVQNLLLEKILVKNMQMNSTIPDAGFFNNFEQKQTTEIDSNRKNVLNLLEIYGCKVLFLKKK